MNNELFAEIKTLSLELRSLIRQGVKEGVDELIEKRNQRLEAWMKGVNELINLTNEQQNFLEDLLQEEQQLVNDLQQEQKQLVQQQRNHKNLNKYTEL